MVESYSLVPQRLRLASPQVACECGAAAFTGCVMRSAAGKWGPAYASFVSVSEGCYFVARVTNGIISNCVL